jgi:thioredoxin reductase
VSATQFDAVIVGGGPAGLNAALYLGRACRRVVVIDSGDARNMAAGVMHNMVGHDGVAVEEFRARAWADLAGYDVTRLDGEVISAQPDDDGGLVAVRLAGGAVVRGRAVLWAAGVRSILPEVAGLAELWGRRIFECPYCHGWEVRGGVLGVYGGGVPSECLAATLTAWTSALTYLSDRRELPADESGRLAAAGIPIVASGILAFPESSDGVAVKFEDGRSHQFRAIFLHTDTEPRIAGLRGWLTEPDLVSVQIDERGRTRLPRLYVAGDLGKNMQQAAMAAASGGLAAMAINADLVREDRPGSLYELPALPQ